MEIFKIGFTGTQVGMTEIQKVTFEKSIMLFKTLGGEFHHGDCIGADAQAVEIVRRICPHWRVICHPPLIPTKRAYCKSDEIRKEKQYLDRNHDIVKESMAMFATPKEDNEQLRSGTWATIRYTRKLNKKLCIIFPDGRLVK